MAITRAYVVPHPPLILPSVGKGQEQKIQKTVDAYLRIAREIALAEPETIILITPHSISYQDYIHISPGKEATGNLGRYGSRETTLRVSYDPELAAAIGEFASLSEIPAGHLGEKDKSLDHATFIPIWFINQYYKNYQVVRISVSGLSYRDHYRFGKCIAEAVDSLGRKAVLIASGDLSHRLLDSGPYDYAEEGPVFDCETVDALSKADFLHLLCYEDEFCEAAGECGLRSFLVMAGALDGLSVKPELLSYEGPFGVGYAVAGFEVTGEDPGRRFEESFLEIRKNQLESIKKDEDEFVQLARASLENYILHRKRVEPVGLSGDLLSKKAGVFVSLKKDGRLRGCMGTISASEDSIAREIIKNALSAGTGDPRFDPVTPFELPELVYSVDVLGKPEPVSSKEELDPVEYGVIVSMGHRRGLLLPNLPGIKTPEQQVEIALKKAGIGPEEDYRMERFQVVRHK